MLLSIELLNGVSRLLMGQFTGLSVNLLQRKQLLFLKLDCAGLVLDQALLLLFNELALHLELPLEAFDGLLVHFAMGLHRLTLSLLFLKDLVLLFLDFRLKNLFGSLHFEHALVGGGGHRCSVNIAGG